MPVVPSVITSVPTSPMIVDNSDTVVVLPDAPNFKADVPPAPPAVTNSTSHACTVTPLLPSVTTSVPAPPMTVSTV